MGSGAVYRVSLGIGRAQYKGDEDQGQLVAATRILMTAPGVTTNLEQLSDCHLGQHETSAYSPAATRLLREDEHRIRTARRRTASAASSWLTGTKLGSASSISWSTPSRGASQLAKAVRVSRPELSSRTGVPVFSPHGLSGDATLDGDCVGTPRFLAGHCHP